MFKDWKFLDSVVRKPLCDCFQYNAYEAEETNLAESFLLKALRMEGFESGEVIPRGYKKEWIAGGYKYEVRVHPSNKKYAESKDILRVGRKQVDADGKGIGKGMEYLDIHGEWHPEKVLKPKSKNGIPNPVYNEKAAKETHIAKPGRID